MAITYPPQWDFKVDSSGDEQILRVNLKNENDAKEWIRAFGSLNNTWCTVGPRYELHKRWACRHNNGRKAESSRLATGCKATIDILIKLLTKKTKRTDSYLKLSPPLRAVIKICGSHNHFTGTAESLRLLRPSDATKTTSEEYFNKDMSASEACGFHQDNLQANHSSGRLPRVTENGSVGMRTEPIEDSALPNMEEILFSEESDSVEMKTEHIDESVLRNMEEILFSEENGSVGMKTEHIEDSVLPNIEEILFSKEKGSSGMKTEHIEDSVLPIIEEIHFMDCRLKTEQVDIPDCEFPVESGAVASDPLAETPQPPSAAIPPPATEAECVIRQLLKSPFWLKTHTEKLQIVERGRPRPEMPSLLSKHKGKERSFIRRFHVIEYGRVPWLTGSASLNKLFCWPCVLFGRESTVWSKEGVSNLNSFKMSVKKHDVSQKHILSVLKLATFGNTRTELELDEQQRAEKARHNQLVSHNRDVMKRLIDCVCHLAVLEAPLHGHDKSSSLDNDHYSELLSLVGSYDNLLKTHLDYETGFSVTSDGVQRYIIEAVGEVVLDRIKEEVRAAPFVAILLDETAESMNSSQLATVLRYVTQEGSVKERFVGFADISADKTAEGVFNHVLKIAEEFEITESKLVAQTYDGAAVKPGHLSRLCSRVLERFPNALFAHFWAHRLDVVLQQVCMSIKDCCGFFLALAGLAAFFSESPQRSAELKSFTEERFPQIALRPVNTVWTFLPQLIEFFDHLIVDIPGDLDCDSLVNALGFRSFLTNFKNFFPLAAFSKIFKHTDVLSKTLQKAALDNSDCLLVCGKTLKKIAGCRERFAVVWDEVLAKRHLCEMEERGLPQKRRVVDEEVEEQAASQRLYNEIVDTVTLHLQDRYAAMEHFKFIPLLDPQLFTTFVADFPTAQFKLLQEKYGDLFDYHRLKNELTIMYIWDEFRGKNPHALMAHMQRSGLTKVLPEVRRLASLVLTIPSTAVPNGASLSGHERIRSHLRASLGQEIMSSLSLLAIEKELLHDLKQSPAFHSLVTDAFANRSQRLEFKYK